MKITFNTPKHEAPKESPKESPKKAAQPHEGKPKPDVQKKDDDRSFDWGGKAVAGRPRTPEYAQGHAELKEEMKALEAIISSFFEKYGDLKTKFESDPEMLREFMAGLANYMRSRVKIDKIAPGDLQNDPELMQKIFESSFEFEREIKKRQAAGRTGPTK
jgi:hypothetical protein